MKTFRISWQVNKAKVLALLKLSFIELSRASLAVLLSQLVT